MNDDPTFWERNSDKYVRLHYGWKGDQEECETVTVAALYEQFKARMLAEMAEAARDREIRRMDIRMKVRRLTSS